MYVVFFYKVFSPNFGFWGSDMVTEYYPVRAYLREIILTQHRFPFWSERIFSGTPIYADMENSYLNVFNVIGILFFGPMLSYKIIHILCYLIGSISIYLLLKRKNVNMLGFAVANLAYYFCFFMLNHQVHLSVILITYLAPLHFLLFDIFIEKKQLKYIVFQALALADAVYWGHIQFPLIIIFGLVLYALVHIKDIGVKQFFLYFGITGFLSLILTLPLLIPNYFLFKDGYRDGGVSYLQGSLMPNAAGTFAYPYLFKRWASYDGYLVGQRFTYTEIYNYMGISVLIIGAFAFIFLKRNKLYYFCYSLVWLVVLLSFLNNEPFLLVNKLILIDLFRYWERTVFLGSLAFGIMAACFISNPFEKLQKKDYLINLALTVAPVAYIFFLIKMNMSLEVNEIGSMANYMRQNITHLRATEDFTRWLILIGVTVLLCVGVVLVKKFKPKYLMYISALVVFIVFADLFLFAQDVLNYRIMDIRDREKVVQIPTEYTNQRIITRSGLVGMEYLFVKSWSPFGYSNFTKNNYMRLLNQVDLTSYKHVVSKSTQTYDDVVKFQALGVVAVFQPKTEADRTLTINENPNTDLLSNIDPSSSYVVKSEGHIVMNVKNNIQQTIVTYLKSDPEWRLYVDGKQTALDTRGVFMNFDLAAGDHKVEFIFTPYYFYYGVGILFFFGSLFAWQYKRLAKLVI